VAAGAWSSHVSVPKASLHKTAFELPTSTDAAGQARCSTACPTTARAAANPLGTAIVCGEVRKVPASVTCGAAVSGS
jgi:hypothetical protein